MSNPNRVASAALVIVCSCAASSAAGAQPRSLGSHADEYLAVGELDSQAGHSFRGRSLVLADVDGDATLDFIAGVAECGAAPPGCDGVRAGRVVVYSGATLARIRDIRGPAYVPGIPHTDQFGQLIHAADLDGDDKAEIIVAAERRHSVAPGGAILQNVGAIDVFSGATGLLLYTVHGAIAHEYFGMTFDVSGDLNADGHPDLLVGSPGRTIRQGGSQSQNGLSIFSGLTGARLFGPGDNAGTTNLRPFVSWSLAALGDVNADGAPDFATTSNGIVYVMTGVTPPSVLRQFSFGQVSLGAPGSAPPGAPPPSNPTNPSSGCPTKLASAGDLDGDGSGDILCLGNRHTPVYGPALVAYSGLTGAELFGVGVAMPAHGRALVNSVTDVNGDGVGDVAYVLLDWPGDSRAVVVSGATGATLRTFADAGWLQTAGDVSTAFSDGFAGADIDHDGDVDFAAFRAHTPETGAYVWEIALFQSPGCPGDANGDASVDFVDLNATLSDYGQTGPGLAGDVTADLVVDFLDLNEVLSGFGSACP